MRWVMKMKQEFNRNYAKNLFYVNQNQIICFKPLAIVNFVPIPNLIDVKCLNKRKI